MNRKVSIFGLSVLILGLIIVPGFTADMNQGDSSGKTFGCGTVDPVVGVNLDDWDESQDEERVAHVYFTEGPGLLERKNDKEAWGKMSYTFCGEPSHFVFNGHGFSSDETEYALIYLANSVDSAGSPQQTIGLLGKGLSNGGGNVHIKGDFDEELAMVKVFLVYFDGILDRSLDREDVVLIGEEPISYALDCMGPPEACDGNVFSAMFSGGTDGAISGKAIFVVEPSGEEIFFKLMVDNAGTISQAYIRIKETGDIEDQRLVQIYPAEMDLNLLPGHDFMAFGVINADDRFNTAVLGTSDPVGSLVRGFNAGLTYATLLDDQEATITRAVIEPADCDALRDLWDLHLGDWGCGGDNSN